MEFSKIEPFVRYVHYLPLAPNSEYADTVPYDNRLFFACHGTGEIEVEGVRYNMERGALLIIPSGVQYRLLTPECDVTYIGINFDYTSENSDRPTPIPPAAAAAYEPGMKLEHIWFSDCACFNGVVYLSDCLHLNGILMNVYREYTHRLIYSDGIMSSMMKELLLQCARSKYVGELRGNSETVNKIIDFIHENYGKRLTNKEIGDRFGLHPNYASNLFRAFTGIPLHRYVLETRISVSVKMLAAHELSISEIAECCGFSGVYHFSKAFKKIIGVSPSKYN